MTYPCSPLCEGYIREQAMREARVRDIIARRNALMVEWDGLGDELFSLTLGNDPRGDQPGRDPAGAPDVASVPGETNDPS
jgi:hypothetical protein